MIEIVGWVSDWNPTPNPHEYLYKVIYNTSIFTKNTQKLR